MRRAADPANLDAALPLPEWPDDQLEAVWRLLVGAEVAPAGP
jgi:hypothetical protein